MSGSPGIVPEETPLTAPYWAAARRGAVALQRCSSCGAVWHPPQPRCPHCRSAAVSWEDASGAARLHSYCVVHHAVHAAVADKVPYIVALVALAEGPLFVCNLCSDRTDEIEVGMDLVLVPGPTPGGLVLPQAVPASTATGASAVASSSEQRWQ